ncbi:MAG: hypothetical protein EAY66_07065 [Sphingobacteriales bacterium]|nr:MAG: hypothetical protein EAY66_07065 [Sphingobacteriales bacterium]
MIKVLNKKAPWKKGCLPACQQASIFFPLAHFPPSGARGRAREKKDACLRRQAAIVFNAFKP